MKRLAIVLALLVASCGGTAPDSTKFKQTWATPYDRTTCADWLNRMDNHQRFVAAGDMLLTLRERDGDPALPPDTMISAFALSMSDMCTAPAGGMVESILDLGPFVYIAFPEEFKP